MTGTVALETRTTNVFFSTGQPCLRGGYHSDMAETRVFQRPRPAPDQLPPPKFVEVRCEPDAHSGSPPAASVRGRLAQFRPQVQLRGGFVEGEKVTASIVFPDLPAGHGPVTMRFVTQWQREEIGSYWITHGEAIARAKLRQRGHYEAVGEQAFFIPTIDTEPLEAKRFLPIESEETLVEGGVRRRFAVNTLEYECSRQDIGCRLRFVCQPVDLCGHLGRAVHACSPHILCPWPKVRSMFIRDTQTALEVQSARLRESAERMRPGPTGELINRPVKSHTLHLIFRYVGGEEGESIVKWYRVQAVRARSSRDAEWRETLVAEQTRKYTIVEADVGCQIRVTVTPVRADGATGVAANLFTTACSNSCPYSSTPHAHIHGVCPYQLSMVDLVSQANKKLGRRGPLPVQLPIEPEMGL